MVPAQSRVCPVCGNEFLALDPSGQGQSTYGYQVPPQTPPPGQSTYGYQAPPQTPPGQNPYGYQTPPPQQYGQPVYAVNPVNESLRIAAFVLCLIGTIILALSTFGIALAWGIPMTVHAYRIIHDPYKHVGFGVCCIIFLGVIAGILLLCSGGEEKPSY
jgi:hypothetical protein